MIKHLSFMLLLISSLGLQAMEKVNALGLTPDQSKLYTTINLKFERGILEPKDLRAYPHLITDLKSVTQLITTLQKSILYEMVSTVIAEANHKENDFFAARNLNESWRKYHLAQACLQILEHGQPEETTTAEFAQAKQALNQIQGKLPLLPLDWNEMMALAEAGELFIEEK